MRLCKAPISPARLSRSGRHPLLGRDFHLFLLALLALCMVAIGGCTPDKGQHISQWRLVSQEHPEGIAINLPGNLAEHMHVWPSRYTLTTVVELPEDYRRGTSTFILPFFPEVPTVRIDGRVTASLDDDDRAYAPRITPRRYHIPDELTKRGTFRVEIDAPIYYSVGGQVGVVPQISPTSAGGPSLRARRDWNLNLASGSFCALLAVSVSAAVIAALSGRRRFLVASIAAFSVAMYPAYLLGYTQLIAGHRDDILLGVAMSITVWATVVAAHERHYGTLPHPLWHVFSFVVALSNLAVLHPAVSDYVPIAAWSLQTTMAVGQFVQLLARRWQDPKPAIVRYSVLLAWTVALALGLPDCMVLAGFTTDQLPLCTAQAGIGIVIVTEILSDVFDRTDMLCRLNQELSTRYDALQVQHTEIHRLNDELRHSVHQKAEELAAVLTRLSMSSTPTFEAGQVLDDRYLLGPALGEGAMGTVFAAERLRDQRKVAVKALKIAADTKTVARFAREAQIATEVAHPNLVPVLDIHVSSSGMPYLVMAKVEGTTLRNSQFQRRSVTWKLLVLADIAAGLHALHSRGIIHRDLKPSNILLEDLDGTGDFTAKITDFGVSTFLDGKSDTTARTGPSELTQQEQVVGTPMYMAPEAFVSSFGITVAADIFSFGVLAREVLSGITPMGYPSLGLAMQVTPEFPAGSLEEICPELSPALTEILDRCLSREPSERPSADELHGALLPTNHRNHSFIDLRGEVTSGPTPTLRSPSARQSCA